MPMTIDCHYHLEPRVQPVDNLIAKMDQNGIEKTALMACMCDPLPHTPEPLLKLLRVFLVNRPLRWAAKMLSARFSDKGEVILPGKNLAIYPDPDNEPVAEALAARPDRFLGWIFVNPCGKNNPIDEFEKYRETDGFIGIKAHPFWHRYAPEKLLPVAEKAAGQGVPLLIHVGFGDHGDFQPLLRELPELKLILAHSGFPCFKDTWQIILPHKNVMVDLSADAYLNGATTRHVVEFLGVERCLFGSDGPYGNTADDGYFDNGFIKRRIESIFPDKGVQNQLLRDNFLEVIS